MTPTYLVFDTETTGLFQYKDRLGRSIPADDPSQPRLASFAAITTDEEGNEISRDKVFIKPDGWTIDGTVAAKVNGLSDEFLNDTGKPVAEVLDLWEAYIGDGLIAAAYNAQFDCKMMRAELRRAGRPDLFDKTRNTCLMRALRPYQDRGLKGKGGMVRLEVACDYFGITNAQAHDAMGDAQAALEIMRRLISDGNLLEPKVHYSNSRAGSGSSAGSAQRKEGNMRQ